MIKLKNSIIPACDISTLNLLDNLVKNTCDLDGVGGYKVGLELVIPYGLKTVVEYIRKYTDLPIIYDHQKAGNDVPKIGERFAKACKSSGVDAVILYPFTGPFTERRWIEACKEIDLHVMVGGHMTHEGFIEHDGGFITEEAPERVYRLAAEYGVVDFVGPYNKPDVILKYTNIFKNYGVNFTWYTPGFTNNMEDIKKCSDSVGDNWHVIIGSEIYGSVFVAEKTKYLIKAILNNK